MGNDINSSKFVSYLSIFVFFMLWGISGNNLLQLLIGWEGIGFMSYLLINFYDTRIEANKSGIKALLVNKIGDIGLLLGIICCYFIFSSVKFNNINTLSYFFKYDVIYVLNLYYLKYDILFLTFICLLFIIAISTKSAQFIFNNWLPDAMEGPTPVSALIHSATMVGIGFLLLLKLSTLFQNCSEGLESIVFIGAITTLLTNFGSIACYDVKGVNANSTGGQLSFMFLSYNSANISGGYLHFTTHAVYKACTFLISGLLIQQWSNNQDLRIINPYLKFQLPVISACVVSVNSSLVGLPSALGSYSKEYIFELNYSAAYSFTFNNWLISFFSSTLTATYAALLIAMTLDNNYNTNYAKVNTLRFNGEPSSLTTPVLGLSIFSLFASEWVSVLFITSNLFDAFDNNDQSLNLDYAFGSWYVKILPMLNLHVLFFVVWLQLRYSLFLTYSNSRIPNINKTSTNIFLDKIYNSIFVKFFWWNYFIIFRLINSKLLNPYNFISAGIRATINIQIFLDKGLSNYDFFIFIYSCMLIIAIKFANCPN